jgi:hypothetical protein
MVAPERMPECDDSLDEASIGMTDSPATPSSASEAR